MMFLLVRDVLDDTRDMRLRHRKNPVPASPGEPSLDEAIFVDPMRGLAFESLTDALDGMARWQNQSVDVICIHEIDFHVSVLSLDSEKSTTCPCCYFSFNSTAPVHSPSGG